MSAATRHGERDDHSSMLMVQRRNNAEFVPSCSIGRRCCRIRGRRTQQQILLYVTACTMYKHLWLLYIEHLLWFQTCSLVVCQRQIHCHVEVQDKSLPTASATKRGESNQVPGDRTNSAWTFVTAPMYVAATH